ncbi:hypothetical protein [Mycobacterium sp.]|uniref:hypothetical protein n=1 Tax=Mycobacterium sp. TaxID=1785 RepID=UPI003D11AA7D
MNRFMLAFTWQQPPDPALAGSEHDRVVELIDGGQMEQVFLASDRSRGWLVMLAESEDAALESASTLPFYPAMHIVATALLDRFP